MQVRPGLLGSCNKVSQNAVCFVANFDLWSHLHQSWLSGILAVLPVRALFYLSDKFTSFFAYKSVSSLGQLVGSGESRVGQLRGRYQTHAKTVFVHARMQGAHRLLLDSPGQGGVAALLHHRMYNRLHEARSVGHNLCITHNMDIHKLRLNKARFLSCRV